MSYFLANMSLLHNYVTSFISKKIHFIENSTIVI